MKFVSIQSKLVKSSTLIISGIFLMVISVVLALNLFTARVNLEMTETKIINSLMAKGKTLVINNSMAMRGMADDNAITEVRALVSSTVHDDDDISYGIYMDADSRPWVFASSENVSGEIDGRDILEDSMSVWASTLDSSSFKRVILPNKDEILEFASPVTLFDEPLGFIRYGISTQSMQQALLAAKRSSRRMTIMSLFALISLAGLAIFSGYHASKKNAIKITRPLHSLAASAKTIAEGNYSLAIQPESDDEVGELANTFDFMRSTIKKFTEHLQDLVDEKMQQVHDIMNNIEQGLFTFNLDGTVNEEYSLSANQILMVRDIAACTLEQLFRLEPEQKSLFYDWIELVKQLHETQRWNKLARLAPIQELELHNPDNGDVRYIKIGYQKIFDKSNQLSKVMVLAMDMTENRRIEEKMNRERVRHEAEMKTILGIVNHPQDEVNDFMEDARNRIQTISEQLDNIFERSGDPTDSQEGVHVELSLEEFTVLYRDLHTLKGNAGSYGFDNITSITHNAENVLEELFNTKPTPAQSYRLLLSLKQGLEETSDALRHIQEKISLLYGKRDTHSVPISLHKIRQITVLSEKLPADSIGAELKELTALCRTLNYRPLSIVLGKYKNTAERIAHSLGKDIQFVIMPEDLEVPPDLIHQLDESLLHIIRNAVDHGLEGPEERIDQGKGEARIVVQAHLSDNRLEIVISDDGRGIDLIKLREKVYTMKLCKNTDSLSEKELVSYIFHPGLSTKEQVSQISGRGIGMDVVKHNIESLGGSIIVSSESGKGTTFSLVIPR
jgi:two-component system, chemotaxis family, sensor kinase CheA